jgi:hypothetical protein
MDNIENPSLDFRDSLGIVSINELKPSEVDNFLGADPDTVIELGSEEAKKSPETQKSVPEKKVSKESTKEEENIEETILGEDKEDNKEKVENKEGGKIDDNIFSSLGKELLDLGVFSLNEGEEALDLKDGQQLLDRFRSEIQKGSVAWLDNFLSDYGDDYKDAFNAIYINGVHPQEYFQQQAVIESLENLDLSIASNQKQVLRAYYKSIEWSEQEIDEELQSLEDEGNLEKQSTRMHKVLLKQEQQQAVLKQQQRQQEIAAQTRITQQTQAAVQKILTDKLKTKEFDGIPVDEKFARETSDFLLQPRYKLGNGEVLTQFEKDLLDLRRPEFYEKKVKVGMLLQMLEKDPTLSKIQKKAISEKSGELFQSLTRQQSTQTRKGEDSISSWGSLLK